MLMNNLTDQTKLLFIKKDGHPNTVLHNCELCPQLLGPVKIHAKIKIQSKHIHSHTDHKQVHKSQARTHCIHDTHAHIPTLCYIRKI